MNELERKNEMIVAEANKILYEKGLWTILSKYGKPGPTGSYELGLMVWRDLDINLESDEMTRSRFFELGAEIASALDPQRMHYRNEFLGKTAGLPVGFLWGIYVSGLVSPEEWKIDLWAMDSKQREEFKKADAVLKAQISDSNRPIILEIKNHFFTHPEYRRKFSGIDIYHAVIEQGVKSVSEFDNWLAKNKGVNS